MSWFNQDGLFLKMGREEGAVGVGGMVKSYEGKFMITADVVFSDALSATYNIVDGSNVETGAYGVLVPKGFRVEEVEIVTQTAFTSSGTIGLASFSLGLKTKDRVTALDHAGFTTAAFLGTNIDQLGEKVVVRVGSTGAGALVGTTLAQDGVLVVANTLHATHPFTAGRAIIRIIGYYP
jgi:hypothetical protein